MMGLATSTSIVGRAGWRLQIHEEAVSTNDLARTLPAWSAVVAHRQTGGRGRFGRSFSSAKGGLWISAVVPAAGGSARWAGFSLSVGLHLLRLMESLGVSGARLRWPNDIMAGHRKLAGLLIEEGSRETLVVGLGLNVFNQPWQEDPSLEGVATRLADLVASPPGPQELTAPVLDALADAHEDFMNHGLEPTIDQLNRHWVPVPVLLALHGKPPMQATFLGLDPLGNLRVATNDSASLTIPHHHIEKLTETQAHR